jgi:ubiquinone/menaquinone biosynthesis C-methylase UbiE
MNRDITTFEEIADEIASFAIESAGDIQRYIVSPAMLEMIGPVTGKSILDLFCGAGYLSRRLASLGANVTAVDSSDRLIGIAGEINNRENENIRYAVAEPTDLSVIEDSTFDDIVCNMGLMITRDLAGTIAELARLVKLGGRFIFSVVHPCFYMPDACWVPGQDGDVRYRAVDNYYSESWWPSEIITALTLMGRDLPPMGQEPRVLSLSKDRSRTERRPVRKIKHRTLATYFNALSARGFNIRRIAEPRPSPEILAIKPELEIYYRLPVALIVEAIFPYL